MNFAIVLLILICSIPILALCGVIVFVGAPPQLVDLGSVESSSPDLSEPVVYEERYFSFSVGRLEIKVGNYPSLAITTLVSGAIFNACVIAMLLMPIREDKNKAPSIAGLDRTGLVSLDE